ncbi:hypothetical protein [Chitinophaga sp. YIM B06452]|uniref:hypothetical protein n=1 Tax=Chitinophaga sp. YIM B06452 TaxID=3082158 RepID=UPI0031FEC307
MTVVISFFSCSKEGTLEVVPEFTKVVFEVRSLKQAPVLYDIKVGDFTVEDSATTIGRFTNVIERSAVAQRLKITEINSKTILLDTMIVIPGSEALYTIYQIDTTEAAKPLFIVGNQENEVPVDTFMQAFYTNDPVMPETFDILVYKIVDFTYAEVPPLYTYKDVKKGQFTEFAPLAINGFYMFEFRTPEGEMIKDMMPIDPQNPFSGGTGESRCDYINNHQISKISSTDIGGGVYFYYPECMFQY